MLKTQAEQVLTWSHVLRPEVMFLLQRRIAQENEQRIPKRRDVNLEGDINMIGEYVIRGQQIDAIVSNWLYRPDELKAELEKSGLLKKVIICNTDPGLDVAPVVFCCESDSPEEDAIAQMEVAEKDGTLPFERDHLIGCYNLSNLNRLLALLVTEPLTRDTPHGKTRHTPS
jgi:hypothetical protein